MCGLAGFFSPRGMEPGAEARLVSMRDALAHRGPDDATSWIDEAAGIALGHRRLSILDLSQAGAQPMASANGRWVVAYNGELYNHRALRTELEAAVGSIAWRGHSDTEVLIEAIAHWGVEAVLPRLNGMFALALWDRRDRRLTLARDPFGEKPLYYGWVGASLVFGSELKALRVVPGFDHALDPEGLAGFVRNGVTPGHCSIYRAMGKVAPGTSINVSMDAVPGADIVSLPFWCAGTAADRARANPFTGNRNEAAAALDGLLRDAVGLRMEADVPLGAMLSGGIDSTLVTALMQARSDRPVQTFTIGFKESGYDEAVHARAIASHLGTDHHELYLDADAALDVVPGLPAIYDEPFADSSQIPTLLVARLARQSVTVALSGDGGDELFGGYNRYFYGARVAGTIETVPLGLRRLAAAGLTMVPPSFWDDLAGVMRMPRSARTGEKLHKLAGVIGAADRPAFHQALLSIWPDAARVLAQPGPPGRDVNTGAGLLAEDFAAGAMLHDTLHYLPDDILTKVDRATMSVSLEGRVPLLDTRVFDFAWSLPMAMKVQGNQGKLVLKDVLDRYVPRAMMERPKQGFAVPVGQWLGTRLRDWGEALLDPRRLRDEGVFDTQVVRQAWDEHQSGRRNHDARLWTVLMFQAWRDEQRR
jgi:asparagine synthase (glutamine-hydrolysing)